MANDDFIPTEDELREKADEHRPPQSMWEPVTPSSEGELILDDLTLSEETSPEDLYGTLGVAVAAQVDEEDDSPEAEFADSVEHDANDSEPVDTGALVESDFSADLASTTEPAADEHAQSIADVEVEPEADMSNDVADDAPAAEPVSGEDSDDAAPVLPDLSAEPGELDPTGEAEPAIDAASSVDPAPVVEFDPPVEAVSASEADTALESAPETADETELAAVPHVDAEPEFIVEHSVDDAPAVTDAPVTDGGLADEDTPVSTAVVEPDGDLAFDGASVQATSVATEEPQGDDDAATIASAAVFDDADDSVDDRAPLMDADEIVAAPNDDAFDPLQTTTIPAVRTPEDDEYVPSNRVPEDVLEARDMDNPPTTAIRRDLMSPQDDAASSVPTWEEAVVPPAALTASVQAEPTGETPDSLNDTIFEGATLVPIVPSRTKSHFASIFLGLFFIPAGWYLFADASARMLFPADAPVMSGQPSWLALAEFAGAVAVWFFFLLLTLRSSVGAWVWGVVLTLLGLPWLVVPGTMKTVCAGAFEWLEAHGGVMGANLSHHVQLSAYSGRFMLMGLVLVALAIVAVVVRRRGRAEEALRAQVAKVNPEAAFLSRRERRRAAKAERAAK